MGARLLPRQIVIVGRRFVKNRGIEVHLGDTFDGRGRPIQRFDPAEGDGDFRNAATPIGGSVSSNGQEMWTTRSSSHICRNLHVKASLPRTDSMRPRRQHHQSSPRSLGKMRISSMPQWAQASPRGRAMGVRFRIWRGAWRHTRRTVLHNALPRDHRT
jgi:hypothetical protein